MRGGGGGGRGEARRGEGVNECGRGRDGGTETEQLRMGMMKQARKRKARDRLEQLTSLGAAPKQGPDDESDSQGSLTYLSWAPRGRVYPTQARLSSP